MSSSRQLFRSAICLLCALCISCGESDSAEEKKKKHTNRLAKETSPYLLLHAHNPVDWYPWGEEALAKAKKENKMIFLSIGYSSCYWCHVMERESFMNEEIAAYLNKHFVCIKVDREERPDIDEIYMTALHLYHQLIGSSRGGGWPLSMFLTPGAKPIGGGTYFPPQKKNGLDGFIDVSKRVQGFWEKDAEAIQKNGDYLANLVRETLRRRPAVIKGLPGREHLDKAQEKLAEQFDEKYGGFGFSEDNPRRPKFPEPSNLFFLLDRARRKGGQAAKKMLIHTLDMMARGGIWDHVGGGFHRYSTDRHWRIPHFEKMLYDNGQLATVYAEAFALTGEKRYQRVTEGILQFVLREMTAERGGFYSALDAETDAEEGKFYVWETEELQKHLPKEDYKLFADVYGVASGPNFEGRHTLLLERPLKESAEKHKLSLDELEAKLAPLRKKLLAVRDKRERPLTDIKILTSWNGMMIRGFADAGRILKNDDYTTAAARAADFVLKNLRGKDGRLLRAYAGGKAKLNAYLDDYACFVDGLLALHQATGEKGWLTAAEELTAKQVELYWDELNGGFFFTSKDHEALIARSKGGADGARPSGNSVSVGNLTYLARALKDDNHFKRAEQTVKGSAVMLDRAPAALTRMSAVLEELLEKNPPEKKSSKK